MFCKVLPVSLPRVVAVHIQGPFSPSYGVCILRVGEGSTHTALLDRVESKALFLISSPSLTDSLPPLKFLRHVASLSIFYCYFHSNCSSELANCMPLKLIFLLFKFFVQELTSIFPLSSLSLVNSGTTFLCLYFLLPTT